MYVRSILFALGSYASLPATESLAVRQTNRHHPTTVLHMTTTAPKASSRRAFLDAAPLSTFLGGTILSSSPLEATSAVDIADDGDFIKALRARSEANREANLKDSIRPDKLSSKQFQGQYGRPKYVFVKTADGSGSKMLGGGEFDELKMAGKIQIEYGTGRDRDGKEFVDYSKANFVLVE